MKNRIFIPGTIIIIIIVLLGFFIGCTVDDPSVPGGKGALVGTWVLIEPGIYREDLTFTLFPTLSSAIRFPL